eukprot:1066366-Prymnesium_polylepis.2
MRVATMSPAAEIDHSTMMIHSNRRVGRSNPKAEQVMSTPAITHVQAATALTMASARHSTPWHCHGGNCAAEASSAPDVVQLTACANPRKYRLRRHCLCSSARLNTRCVVQSAHAVRPVHIGRFEHRSVDCARVKYRGLNHRGTYPPPPSRAACVLRAARRRPKA